uniref:SHSP domain-containing protein n=1 Tax=Fagus sylvatica TaxID=28930 RepID=A0A2N9IGD7_FAGSY
MDAKLKPVNRVYEDIDPQIEWAYEEGLDTVIVHLPEFRKEQLKVEIASTGNIRVSGQRSLGNNKWKRFVKEIPIPSNKHLNRSPNEPKPRSLEVKSSTTKPNVDGKSNNANDMLIMLCSKETQQRGGTGSTSWNSRSMQGDDVFQKTTGGKEQTSSIDGKSTSSTAEKAETITRVSERQGEKNEPIDANKKKSIETDADNVSQENLEKERSGWFEKTGEVTSSSTSEKHGNIFETVRDALMMMDKGARGNEDGSGKYVVEGYKQVVGGMATELKKTNLINLVVAGLLVLVLALYVKNALFKTVFNEDK